MINCFLLGEHSTLEIIKPALERIELAKLVGRSADVGETLEFVRSFGPKIVFIDAVHLGSNRDILLQIARETNIIYISSCMDSAYEAFEMMAFGYLFSPFTSNRIEKSIYKFIRSSMLNSLAPIQDFPVGGKIVDSLFIKADTKGQKEILIRPYHRYKANSFEGQAFELAPQLGVCAALPLLTIVKETLTTSKADKIEE